MFEWLRESIWGYPIVAAIHVLGLAWFGWTVLVADRKVVAWKRLGLALLLVTGALLFGMHAVRYSASTAFRLKMLLLVLLLFTWPRRVTIVLWISVIFASRAIAYF